MACWSGNLSKIAKRKHQEDVAKKSAPKNGIYTDLNGGNKKKKKKSEDSKSIPGTSEPKTSKERHYFEVGLRVG